MSEREIFLAVGAGAAFIVLYTAPCWLRFFRRRYKAPTEKEVESPTELSAEEEEALESAALLRKLHIKKHEGKGDAPPTSPMLSRNTASPASQRSWDAVVEQQEQTTTTSPSKKPKKRVHMCLEKNEIIGDAKPAATAAAAASRKADDLDASPLAEALKAGKKAAVLRKEFQRDPKTLLKSPSTGRTLLHIAAEVMTAEQEDVLPLLVTELGIDKNAQDKNNGSITALTYACAARPDPVALAFIQFMSSVESQDRTALNFANPTGWTALHVACGRNRAPIVKALLDAGASTTLLNSQKCTPLHIAVLSGAKDAALALLDHSENKSDVNACDAKIATPLHLAMNGGFPMYVVASKLIDLGANVDARDENKATPLHWALRRGHGRLSALLFANHADVTLGDAPHSVTPLHLVASTGDRGLLETFLNRRPPVNLEVKDSAGRTPLAVAAIAGHLSTTTKLIAAGALLNVVDRQGASPLLWALREGRKDVAVALIEHGARLSGIVDSFGNTPLQLACYQGKPFARLAENIAEKCKESVNKPDKQGHTPLHWVAAHGDTQLCTALLEAGANVDARESTNGVLPLHWAAGNAQPNTVEILFLESRQRGNLTEAQAANVEDKNGRTPLHWLSRRARECNTTHPLADAGDPQEDSMDPGVIMEGITDPGRIERVLSFLIVHGGNLDAMDKNGVSPRSALAGTPFLADLISSQDATAEVNTGDFVAFGN